MAFLVGLNSWLFLRDLESCGMEETLRELRAGEPSREVLEGSGGPAPKGGTFSEGGPDMTCRRMCSCVVLSILSGSKNSDAANRAVDFAGALRQAAPDREMQGCRWVGGLGGRICT